MMIGPDTAKVVGLAVTGVPLEGTPPVRVTGTGVVNAADVLILVVGADPEADPVPP
jgi:hypothetical protein